MPERTLVVFLCLLLASTAFANQPSETSTPVPVRIDDAGVAIVFRDGETFARLSPLVASARDVTVRARIEVVAPSGTVVASVGQDVTLARGRRSTDVALPLHVGGLSYAERSMLAWYRLRYTLTPGGSGIVSLSEAAADLFELHVETPGSVRRDGRIETRVRAVRPGSDAPMPGVRVYAAAEFDVGDEERTLTASGATNGRGYAVLRLDLPKGVTDDDVDVEVRAERNGFVQETSTDVEIDEAGRTVISTDKGLYQPGQTMRMRVLAFDRFRRAIADAPVTIEVEDQDGSTVFEGEARTSRFGVASAEWQIPDSAPLGDYSVEAEITDGPFEDAEPVSAWVKVSRYELPNFAVTTKPDRAYYLPGQNARVEVRADYLFGKPVTSGRVRVVREMERRWDFGEQKWEVDEGEAVEGEIGRDGSFAADLDLSEKHKEIASEDHSRFEDLEYAAYVTDASTGRTEQRRFALRVTREDIHLYVVSEYGQIAGLPIRAYVIASYADGNPAVCDVTVRETSEAKGPGTHLASVRTNRFGVARIPNLSAPISTSWETIGFDLRARDGEGRTGHQGDSIWISSHRTAILVDTDRSILRPGEPIRGRIHSTVSDVTAFVDVASGPVVLGSFPVALREGETGFTIPYEPRFRGEITITASFPEVGDESGNDFVGASRTVVYPADDGLTIDVRADRDEYRPGDEARVSFSARTPDGQPVESVLGVTVVDSAVLARERTEQDFGRSARARYWYAFAWTRNEEVSGVMRSDLLRIDSRKRIDADLDVVAEVLLRDGYPMYGEFDTNGFARNIQPAFETAMTSGLAPVKSALDDLYDHSLEYPEDAKALRAALAGARLDFDAFEDPWGERYRAEFSVESASDVMRLVTAGPDKRPGTRDDFDALVVRRPYFVPTGRRIDEALASWHARTGAYVRDAATLAEALRQAGIEPKDLRDRWGRPYEPTFDVERTDYVVRFGSLGPDGTRGWEASRRSDDFVAWTARMSHVARWAARVEAALAAYGSKEGRYPTTEAEFRTALASEGIDPATLRDPWGRSYVPSFGESKSAQSINQTLMRMEPARPGESQAKAVIVDQTVRSVTLSSVGPDGVARTYDDFPAARFESDGSSRVAGGTSARRSVAAGTGVISGTVRDANGAVIPNATVQVRHDASGFTVETATDQEGYYQVAGLPAGYYTLTFDAPSFKRAVLADMLVASASRTSFDATLEVGSVSEAVAVVAEESTLQTVTASQVSSVEIISTPRLREYFPETLLWEPSLETRANGRARLAFKLADSITTWKLSVVASTADGRIGVAERDLRAFQPFFVEHDPPRVLTVGDEIALPVVLRNYLDGPQRVDVSMQQADWFTMLGPNGVRAEVAPGEPSREVFSFRAVAAVDSGKQRVTALGRRASDAVEKPVDVHPDGEERSATAGNVLAESGSLAVDVPDHAIAGSLKAELKVYPNLLAHVVEGVEAVMRRPYGCGEQTISSTYPSLLVLRAYERMGRSDAAIAEKARRYLELGYKRLLGYRGSDGGFSYWGGGSSDVALTAYALRFLSDARTVTKVDDGAIEGARRWLLQKQRTDGGWARYGSASDRTLTAYVAAAVAASAPEADAGATSREAVERALSLEKGADEPYALAAYLLAATPPDAAVAARLAALAKEGVDGAHWEPVGGTPFHGWGRAGQVEGTALAIRALLRAGGHEDLVRRATYFLVRNKDRYGVWYSTQATVAALDALDAVSKATAATTGGASRLEVFVNGRAVAAVPLSDRGTGPVLVDLSPHVAPGRIDVEVRGAVGAALAAQLVATWYVPWEYKSADSDALSFEVRYDKTEAAPGEPVVCRVDAGRTGKGRGYGMLLAEIGLPPGAEVDRESLQRAMETEGWSLDRFDVLPDRVIAYLWPYGDKSARFEFTFRVRYGISARTAPSTLYDYYNPDARSVIAPVRFVVGRLASRSGT